MAGPQPNVGDPHFQNSQGQRPPDGSFRQGQLPSLSEEERMVMKECERDSFFKRALPLSAGSMFAAHGLVRSGKWSPHPRFGPFPKMIITGGVGYFLGKLLYLPVCRQKILDKIPQSNLAVAVRKSMGIPEPDFDATLVPESDDSGRKSKLSDDYSAFEGLDDRNRPSIDREVKPDEEDKESKKSITYDELRRRNRQEYEDNMAKRPPRPPGSPSYKDSEFMPQQPWPARPRSRPPASDDIESPRSPDAPTKKPKTNIWGDPIE